MGKFEVQNVDSVKMYKIRKTLDELTQHSGRGTELISVYIPKGQQLHEIMNQLREEQGKFWKYHDLIYEKWEGENTGWLTRNVLDRIAEDAELDLNKFNSCMNDSKYRQKVLETEQFAREINIDATPSFIIFNDTNAYRIIGAQPFEKFEQVLNELG